MAAEARLHPAVLLAHGLVVAETHVAHAGEHQVLGHLGAESRKAADERGGGGEPQAGFVPKHRLLAGEGERGVHRAPHNAFESNPPRSNLHRFGGAVRLAARLVRTCMR